MEVTEILGIAAIPAITVICLLIVWAIKATSIDNKWLPVISGALGGVLGVVAMMTMAEFPATEILPAIAIGIVSGFAATGMHQAVKQLVEKSE